jgi:hypothetical protein
VFVKLIQTINAKIWTFDKRNTLFLLDCNVKWEIGLSALLPLPKSLGLKGQSLKYHGTQLPSYGN